MRLPLRIKVSHLLGLVAAVAVVLGLDAAPGGCACGSFDQMVTLKPRADRPVVAVAFLVMSKLSSAENLVKNPETIRQGFIPVSYVPGQPFEVEVPFSRQYSSLLGRPLTRYQARAVLLRLDHADGTRQLLAQGLPDRRMSRSLAVVVP